MNDWLHNLPVAWMALLVFGVTYLLAAWIGGRPPVGRDFRRRQ